MVGMALIAVLAITSRRGAEYRWTDTSFPPL